MTPGSVIELPKADRRYKPGSIKKDKKGQYRGHPDTVRMKYLVIPHNSYGLPFSLNPPKIVSIELGKWLKKHSL